MVCCYLWASPGDDAPTSIPISRFLTPNSASTLHPNHYCRSIYRNDPSSAELTGQDVPFHWRNPKGQDSLHTHTYMWPHSLPPGSPAPLKITQHLQISPQPGSSQQVQPGPSQPTVSSSLAGVHFTPLVKFPPGTAGLRACSNPLDLFC